MLFFFSFHNIDVCLWIDALVLLFNETLRYISKFFLNYRNLQAGIYLFKVNNENTRTNCEIWSKLTVQTLERCNWYRSGVLLLTLNVFHTLSSCFHPKKHFWSPWCLKDVFSGTISRLPSCLEGVLRIQWGLIFANVIRCSRLRLWVGYFIYFKLTPVLLMDVFSRCSLIQLKKYIG